MGFLLAISLRTLALAATVGAALLILGAGYLLRKRAIQKRRASRD